MAKKKKAQKKVKKAAKKTAPAASRNESGIMPLQDRVVLTPLTKEEMGRETSFGIIIPETVDKEKSEQGTVVAVGPGKRGDDNELIPVSVQVGDRVMFSKYGYDEVKINGVEYYIVSEGNILAILK